MKHTYWILCAILFSTLAACGEGKKEEKKEETEKFGQHRASDFKEESNKADKKGRQFDSTFAISDTFQLKTILADIQNDYAAQPSGESTILDRFSFERREKVLITGKKKVPYGKSTMLYPKGEVYLYEYKDSAQAMNTLYNWLDCFGSDCAALTLLKDVEHIKMPPAFVMVGGNKILWLKYPSEHKANDFGPVKEALVNAIPEEERYYQIDVDAGGPLTWKGFNEESDSLYMALNP